MVAGFCNMAVTAVIAKSGLRGQMETRLNLECSQGKTRGDNLEIITDFWNSGFKERKIIVCRWSRARELL